MPSNRKPPIGRRWSKGVSGNPKGRPPDVLREALLARIGVDRIAELVAAALEAGDARTLALIVDRLWPRPPAEHRLEATGAGGAPLVPVVREVMQPPEDVVRAIAQVLKDHGALDVPDAEPGRAR